MEAPDEPVDVVSFEEAYPQYVSWCCQDAILFGGCWNQIVNRSAVLFVRYCAKSNVLNKFGVQTVVLLHEELLPRQRIISVLKIARVP